MTPANGSTSARRSTALIARPSTDTLLVTMRHFTQEELHELHTAAIATGLFNSRAALLAGISPFWVAGLPDLPDKLAQILVDLNRLNEAELADGSVPFDTWLRNAAQLSMTHAQGAVFLT